METIRDNQYACFQLKIPLSFRCDTHMSWSPQRHLSKCTDSIRQMQSTEKKGSEEIYWRITHFTFFKKPRTNGCIHNVALWFYLKWCLIQNESFLALLKSWYDYTPWWAPPKSIDLMHDFHGMINLNMCPFLYFIVENDQINSQYNLIESIFANFLYKANCVRIACFNMLNCLQIFNYSEIQIKSLIF